MGYTPAMKSGMELRPRKKGGELYVDPKIVEEEKKSRPKKSQSGADGRKNNLLPLRPSPPADHPWKPSKEPAPRYFGAPLAINVAERQPYLVKNRAQYIADHKRKQAAEAAKLKRIPYSPSGKGINDPRKKFASNLARFEADFGVGMGSSHAGVVDAPGRLQSATTPPQEAQQHQQHVLQVPSQHNNTPHSRPESDGSAARPDTTHNSAGSGSSSGSGTHASAESPPGDTEHERSSRHMTRSQVRAQAAISELAVASSSRVANNPDRKNTGGDLKGKGPKRSAGNKESRRPPPDIQTTAPQGRGQLNRKASTSIGDHSRLKQGLPYSGSRLAPERKTPPPGSTLHMPKSNMTPQSRKPSFVSKRPLPGSDHHREVPNSIVHPATVARLIAPHMSSAANHKKVVRSPHLSALRHTARGSTAAGPKAAYGRGKGIVASQQRQSSGAHYARFVRAAPSHPHRNALAGDEPVHLLKDSGTPLSAASSPRRTSKDSPINSPSATNAISHHLGAMMQSPSHPGSD
ncbi:hypothetical protein HYPSUDRAFT_219100 [Hypholoma sublateritium FD-334 SS-4]|uniref:Uncharacterized protein n=1 Tax=Hypholoma sublateritium (strain FD-334 SS-4) TaxID=945553 RepID=A0A0D2P9K2_HYPSF|nr:hypothetical protein HYPSUDRAFT_219100 [Hypholoma sublateritium FD-334 SS-4]